MIREDRSQKILEFLQQQDGPVNKTNIKKGLGLGGNTIKNSLKKLVEENKIRVKKSGNQHLVWIDRAYPAQVESKDYLQIIFYALARPFNTGILLMIFAGLVLLSLLPQFSPDPFTTPPPLQFGNDEFQLICKSSSSDSFTYVRKNDAISCSIHFKSTELQSTHVRTFVQLKPLNSEPRKIGENLGVIPIQNGGSYEITDNLRISEEGLHTLEFFIERLNETELSDGNVDGISSKISEAAFFVYTESEVESRKQNTYMLVVLGAAAIFAIPQGIRALCKLNN